MKTRSGLELTLAILKPDLITHLFRFQRVKERILNEKFLIIRWKMVQWQQKNAEQFYSEHKGKFYFRRLIRFMSSGPIMPIILARENAVDHWRYVMGPTKRAKFTRPDSIRGMFGLTDTRNATHGSDSAETAEKEMKFFFPDFHSSEWMQNYAADFQNGNVKFDEILGIHKPIKSGKI